MQDRDDARRGGRGRGRRGESDRDGGDGRSIPAYDKLSKLDETFLAFETPNTGMHVALTGIFDAGPLTTADGGIDVPRIRAHVASRLHLLPRYRQRLAFVPLVSDAIWVDDDRFDLRLHVRHTSLPRPGNDAQLRTRCAEILERPLDRARPLWESWIIEGVAGDRFALLTKVHHCMVDGVGGVELLAVLLGFEPQAEPAAPEPWQPRPVPREWDLVRDEVVRRGRRFAGLGRGLGEALRGPGTSGRAAGAKISALWSLLTTGLGRPPVVPFNGEVGPHRRVAWQAIDLDDVKAIRHRLGGTVNDVVLTIVAGALRRCLRRRPAQAAPARVKVAVPVNVRAAAEQGRLGNRVSIWVVPLPVDVPDPVRSFTMVSETSARLKASNQKGGAEVLTQAAEWTSGTVLHAAVRLLSSASPYNLIVTNVPGPQVPFYLLNSPMREGYPYLPLFEHQGLGIALFSYGGRLYWGLTGDWDLMADLDEFASDVIDSFEELRRAAGCHRGRSGATAGAVPAAGAHGRAAAGGSAAPGGSLGAGLASGGSEMVGSCTAVEGTGVTGGTMAGGDVMDAPVAAGGVETKVGTRRRTAAKSGIQGAGAVPAP